MAENEENDIRRVVRINMRKTEKSESEERDAENLEDWVTLSPIYFKPLFCVITCFMVFYSPGKHLIFMASGRGVRQLISENKICWGFLCRYFQLKVVVALRLFWLSLTCYLRAAAAALTEFLISDLDLDVAIATCHQNYQDNKKDKDDDWTFIFMILIWRGVYIL